MSVDSESPDQADTRSRSGDQSLGADESSALSYEAGKFWTVLRRYNLTVWDVIASILIVIFVFYLTSGLFGLVSKPKPENRGAIIALAAALITFITYVITQYRQRKKLRRSLYFELSQHQDWLDTTVPKIRKAHTESDKLPDLSHTVVPTEAYDGQIGELGCLTKEEVRLLMTYYSWMNIFEEQLEELEDSDRTVNAVFDDNIDNSVPVKLMNSVGEVIRALGFDPEEGGEK